MRAWTRTGMALVAALPLLVAGCNSGSDSDDTSAPATSRTTMPTPVPLKLGGGCQDSKTKVQLTFVGTTDNFTINGSASPLSSPPPHQQSITSVSVESAKVPGGRRVIAVSEAGTFSTHVELQTGPVPLDQFKGSTVKVTPLMRDATISEGCIVTPQ